MNPLAVVAPTSPAEAAVITAARARTNPLSWACAALDVATVPGAASPQARATAAADLTIRCLHLAGVARAGYVQVTTCRGGDAFAALAHLREHVHRRSPEADVLAAALTVLEADADAELLVAAVAVNPRVYAAAAS